MNARDRRLAALAAVFAPARAAQLLARLGTPGSDETAAIAAELAACPRRERLAALAAALGPESRPPEPLAHQAERPRVAALLRELELNGNPPGPPAAPALLRLCRERLAARG